MSEDLKSGVGNKRKICTTAPLGISGEPISDGGSNKNPPISSDEAVDIVETSCDDSDSENNFDEDALNSSVREKLISALTNFLCENNIPLSMIFDVDFFNEFGKIAFLKIVHNVDVAQLRGQIALLFCKQAFPPKMIKDRFFTEFLKVQISEDAIQKDCLDIFKLEKSKLKSIIENMDQRLSLSVEILTHGGGLGGPVDPCYKQSHSWGPKYLCLKAHFIDEFWKRKSLVLGFYMVGNAYLQNPEPAVKRTLSSWGIESKVFTVTTGCDILSNEVFENVKDRIVEKSELQPNGRLFRVSCCAGLLSRMVLGAFKEIESEILDIQIISFWPKSPPLWYLTLHNLKQALELESEGEFDKDEYKGYDIPSSVEWRKVRGVYKIVDTIYNIAKTLFDTKLSTAPMFFHGLLELQSKFKEETQSSEVFVNKLAANMLGKLKEYWTDMSLVLSIATVLDPRCKMKFVEFSLSKFKAEDKNSEIAIVQDAIQSLYYDYETKTVSKMEYPLSDLGSDSDENEADENLQKKIRKKQESSKDVFKWVNEYEELTKIDNRPIKSELVAYLEESVLPWSNDFSALSWWRGARHRYPILSKMAQEFLAIPLSLAKSYDAYSTGEGHIDYYISLLDRETRNPLMCTQSWLRKR